MNELIRTSAAIIGGEEQQTVNARELWKFLESKQEFANWIKGRIKEYGFEAGKDFCFMNLGSKNGMKSFGLTNLSNQNSRGGDRRSIEYWLSINMAKELAMVENNERGKQARQYFIEVEKNARKFSDALNNRLSVAIPIIRENERLRARLEFASHFLPHGNPGELNENGEHKTQFRRGYYTAGRGRSITALIERIEQPGLFDAVELKEIAGRIA